MHDSHQKAAEFHNLAAHTHLAAAEHQGQEDHLTGHEHSRQALEHSNKAYQNSSEVHQKPRTEHGLVALPQDATEENIAARAYQLWQARHCPEGSPQVDWFRAVEELQSRR